MIECRDNYFDTSGSWWGFKRVKVINNADVANDDNAPLFKYKAGLFTDTKSDGAKNRVKIAVALKYLSNFWR